MDSEGKEDANRFDVRRLLYPAGQDSSILVLVGGRID